MRTSEEIAELSAALVAVQAEIENVDTDSEGQIGNKYTQLSTVLRTVRPVLAKHGIAMIQSPGLDVDVGDEGGQVIDRATLTTRLLHTSGQWIEGVSRSRLADLTEKQSRSISPVNAVKAAVSTMRRTAALAMTGIAEHDDDSQTAAAGPTSFVPVTATPQPAAAPAQPAAPTPTALTPTVAPAATVAQPAAVDEAAVLAELEHLAMDTVAESERVKTALAAGPEAVEKLLRQALQSAILAECARLNADIAAFEASLAKRGAKAITDLTTDQMREAVTAMRAQPAPGEAA